MLQYLTAPIGQVTNERCNLSLSRMSTRFDAERHAYVA